MFFCNTKHTGPGNYSNYSYTNVENIASSTLFVLLKFLLSTVSDYIYLPGGDINMKDFGSSLCICIFNLQIFTLLFVYEALVANAMCSTK